MELVHNKNKQKSIFDEIGEQTKNKINNETKHPNEEDTSPAPSEQQISDSEHQKRLSAAILCSIDIEANFKLFSYRIIDAPTFISRTQEIINYTKTQI